ncbi:GNAT family N-acetyltransferase [Leifsonia sp. NPDC080035]|uniref:GNAT family N-acetyltransferase n=1 Tax=Leifsonia sp. NPDC080035 TaxID=3143936 RepID=A0AAU7GGR2_9MICO
MQTSIRPEPPRQPEVEELLRLGDDFTRALYPAESCHLLDVAELERPGVTVFVGRDEGGSALGMAALVAKHDGSAELKRMFVRPEARGRGLASALLGAVESAAADAGVAVLRLETGPRQPAAIALYERRGYSPIPLFGEYIGDPNSICYEKALTRR